MLRYYYDSLSLEFIFLSVPLSVCSQYLNLCLCVCFSFLFTTFGLSAYPYDDDTQSIARSPRFVLLTNVC